MNQGVGGTKNGGLAAEHSAARQRANARSSASELSDISRVISTPKMPQHEDSIARKPLQRFKRLTGSLETLISSIARDWEDLATAPAADAVGLLEDDGPTVHGKMRKAQLLFTELHSTTRKTHSAIETIR